jgi:hypothetical protein
VAPDTGLSTLSADGALIYGNGVTIGNGYYGANTIFVVQFAVGDPTQPGAYYAPANVLAINPDTGEQHMLSGQDPYLSLVSFPSIFHTSGGSGSASHFLLSVASNSTAGMPFAVTLTALDNLNSIATAYSGTVTFTSSDPYPGVLPADYTFRPSDQGTHTFTGVTLFTTGTQTLTVQDTTNSTLTGSATITVSPASTSRLLLTAPPTPVAGTAFDVTVTALDPYGNVATGYTGTVTLTSSDRYPQPSDYAFTVGDNGAHMFLVSLFTAGAQTLTARDAVNGSIGGRATVIVGAAPANHFLVTTPLTAIAGLPFDMILTTLDPYGNTDTNYEGTVTFTTSDTGPGVVLPASYTFTIGDDGDNGVHTFPAEITLSTPGFQFIFVSDPVNGVVGVAEVTVSGGEGRTNPPPGGGGARSKDLSMIPDPTPAARLQLCSEVAVLDRFFTLLEPENSGMATHFVKRFRQGERGGCLVDLFHPDFPGSRL